jgi:hypothetical protein
MDIINVVQNKKFGCQILLHRSKGKDCLPEKMYFWKGYKFETFTKWRWYFRYRAALIQVKYPTRYVELREFDYQYIPEAAELKKRQLDLIIGNKGKLTKTQNNLAAYVKNWDSLFPISDDETFIYTTAKIAEMKEKIRKLESQLKDI